MNNYSISSNQINEFKEHGVTFCKGAFDKKWIKLLSQGVQRNMKTPGRFGRRYSNSNTEGEFFYDTCNWQNIPEFKRFFFESPCHILAKQILECKKVNLFFETLFCRSHGAQKETPWHQDQPYWPINDQTTTCSIWIPLVSVEKESSLEFIKGTHKVKKNYEKFNFANLNPDKKEDVFTITNKQEDIPIPDIAKERDKLDIISWDMQPGDCTIHDPKILHGGSGKLKKDKNLLVFNSQWIPYGSKIFHRKEGMDPDIVNDMEAMGLNDGDVFTTELFPLF